MCIKLSSTLGVSAPLIHEYMHVGHVLRYSSSRWLLFWYIVFSDGSHITEAQERDECEESEEKDSSQGRKNNHGI